MIDVFIPDMGVIDAGDVLDVYDCIGDAFPRYGVPDDTLHSCVYLPREDNSCHTENHGELKVPKYLSADNNI